MKPRKPEKDLDIYKFASLARYPLRKKLIIYAVDFLLYSTLTLIGRTIRFEEIDGWEDSDIKGFENFETALHSGKSGINSFWHNRLFLMTYFWKDRETAVMVSQSFDGEYISRTAQRFGFGVIRGSSTRGGSNALKQMLKLSEEGIEMTLTVDGPKGPKYKVKPGVINLAKQTGKPIFPILAEAKKFWSINSWDNLQIPKPFTKAKIFFGEPVVVPKNADDNEFKAKQKELQRKLDELVEIGKQWRNSNG